MTFYESIFLQKFLMKLLGLLTTEHFLVLFYDAYKTLTLPGRFGMAGLKLGLMGETVKGLPLP